MGEYLSPNLFIEERSASAGPVAGVSTSTFATVGWLEKGPENEAQLVSSFAKFTEIFGGYTRNSYVPFMVDAFFNNEGSRAYVTRVVPSDATKAANAAGMDDAATAATFTGKELPATVDLSTNKNISIKIDGAAKTDIDCSGSTPAATTRAEIAAAIHAISGITCTLSAANRLVIVSDTTGATSSLEFVAPTSLDASKLILGLDVTSTSYKYSGEALSNWTVTAAWKGAWYNTVRLCLTGDPDYETSSGGFTRYKASVDAESSVGAGDWETLESYSALVLDDDTADNFIATVLTARSDYVTMTDGTTYNAPRSLRPTYHLAEWIASGTGALQTFTKTLLRPAVVPGTVTVTAGAIVGTDAVSGTISGTGITSGTINYTTGEVSITYVTAPLADVPITVNYYHVPSATELCAQLTGGTDGTGPLTRADVSDSALQADKKGIYSFDDLDEILNIALPDFAGVVAVGNDLIAMAESKKNRFAILTTPIATEPADAVTFVKTTAQYNTSYAALYYPWIQIYDPIANDGRSVTVPPDGFVAGVFARTDVRRNVGKAPAGINEGKLVGAVGLERILNKAERDTLYPYRINPIMSSPQTGRAIWGARTLSKDMEWTYINVRRLFMFCEQSIYDASFWMVFENNGPGLWAKAKAQGDGFFNNIFRDGYLAGTKPSEAWFVKIDGENNPQSAIDAGLFTADYYIAPNKPAEFVRLRFQQKVKAAS